MLLLSFRLSAPYCHVVGLSVLRGWQIPCFNLLFLSVKSIGKLRQLRYLDLAKNRIEALDADISGCESLEDLLLSSNMLQQLPDSIGTQRDRQTERERDRQTDRERVETGLLTVSGI